MGSQSSIWACDLHGRSHQGLSWWSQLATGRIRSGLRHPSTVIVPSMVGWMVQK